MAGWLLLYEAQDKKCRKIRKPQNQLFIFIRATLCYASYDMCLPLSVSVTSRCSIETVE